MFRDTPLLALALVLWGWLAAMEGGASELRVVGTELQIEVGDRTLRGAELVGAELDIDGLGTLRIESAEQDDTARFQTLWLYHAKIRGPVAPGFEALCEPDPAGDTRLLFFQGDVDDSQRYVADPERFAISCVSGVQAKCLRWGYEPWRAAPLGGESLAPYFETCLRLARADHCGDGVPGTVNGNLIDIYDRIGVQAPEADPGELSFEAGWDEQGAVCAHHPRIADGRTLDDLVRECPRLNSADVGATCDEAVATQRGARLFNRSKVPATR